MVVIVLVLLAAAAGFWRFARLTRDQEATIARLESEIRELRSKPSPPAGGAVTQPEARPAGPPPGTRDHLEPAPGPKPSESQEGADATEKNREAYLAATAAVEQMRQRVAEMQEKLDQITAENQRLTASEKEIQEKLNAARREAETASSQAKAAADRAERIDNSYRIIRDEARKSNERISQLQQLNRELEDLNRRRENYLNSIIRRYREVTEQYRGLASRLEHSRETPATAPGELSSIQNAISMAEEDFRQLQALNAQAAALARKYRQ
jgi:DNA repair exonuclease SbcCD ATPase subunit